MASETLDRFDAASHEGQAELAGHRSRQVDAAPDPEAPGGGIGFERGTMSLRSFR